MKSKYTSYYFLFVFVIFSISLISSPIKAQDKTSGDEIVKMQSKIEMLEKKLQKQEDEINNLKKEVDNLKKRRPMLAVPDLKNGNNFRRGKPFEFNGQLYYMVPLNTEIQKKVKGK